MALLVDKKIILASNSKRRAELLGEIFDNFEIILPNIEEKLDNSLEIDKAVEKIAIDKVKSIKNNADIIISADTLVFLEKTPLAKPKDKDDAVEMLKMLSNKTHKVITGVAIRTKNGIKSFSVVSYVTFFELTYAEIEEYTNTDEPYDKAGGYGIQGRGKFFVKEITGDFYSVMGLPIAKLKREILDIF